MSDLSIVSAPDLASRVDPIRRPDAASPANPAPPQTASADTVEISDQARLLNRLRDLPAVRADLVQRVRADLSAGRYDDAHIPDEVLHRIVEDFHFPY